MVEGFLQAKDMPHEFSKDWKPLEVATLKDPRKAFDKMREQCPVAHSHFPGWFVFRHEDIAAVLADPETFINGSKFPAIIPNGLNPPGHSSWYSALATFSSKGPMAWPEPRVRQRAGQWIEPQNVRGEAEFVAALITPFVFSSLYAVLGWPVQQGKALAT